MKKFELKGMTKKEFYIMLGIEEKHNLSFRKESEKELNAAYHFIICERMKGNVYNAILESEIDEEMNLNIVKDFNGVIVYKSKSKELIKENEIKERYNNYVKDHYAFNYDEEDLKKEVHEIKEILTSGFEAYVKEFEEEVTEEEKEEVKQILELIKEYEGKK